MSKNIIIAGVLIVALVVVYVVYVFSQNSGLEEEIITPDTSQQVESMQKEVKMDDEEKEAEEEMVEYMDISPEEARKMINENPNLVVIDVSPHYDKGHLPGAIHYYLGDGSLDRAIPSLDKSKEYLVYCHVDSVAIAGAKKLVDAGFSPVYRLEGNYGTWVNNGYPIEK